MNPVDEMNEYLMSDDEYLAHYGMPRRSGRYPWGSGEDPYQHGSSFKSRIDELKSNGWTETPENIKEAFGMSVKEYRQAKSIATNEVRAYNVNKAKGLALDGLSPTEIGKRMGVNESTVRGWLNEDSIKRMNQAQKTAEMLKKEIDKKGMIDVGKGVEHELGISRTKLDTALQILKEQGYNVYGGRVDQLTNPGQKTTISIATRPEIPHKEIFNTENIKTINEYTSDDNGETFRKFEYPKSLDSSRVFIKYAEDGGTEKDGLVELRKGVEDISLGDSHYSQVRILVDDRKYIKGMAVYSDDIPDGYDVVVNSNKPKSKGMEGALKDIKNDPDNPFGSTIAANGQRHYIDENGKEQLSVINKRADEGDWTDWQDKLPAQFLSKQSTSLAKKQLDLALTQRQQEFDDIMALDNPTVKKSLLSDFADNCDSASVKLYAAALPNQKYHVIIPVNSLKDDEVYAPRYENGTKLALIRYPHGGTFEIPICTVNNKNKDASKIIPKDSIDAVGINKKVADRLSGADFDGDTVMVIPTGDSAGKVNITSRALLKGLIGFDDKDSYGTEMKKDPETGEKLYYRNGVQVKTMAKGAVQNEMGKISNLITDMTLLGANDDELAAAVRHSMVVIDAEKHKLDYKASEIDNNIKALKQRYQKKADEEGKESYGGASTLISRSKGQQTIDKRQGSPYINDPDSPRYDPSRPDGALIYKKADNLEYTYEKVNKKTGKVTVVTDHKTQKSTQMAETDDARTLVSEAKTKMELLYADYANSLKSMANKARMELVHTGKIAYNRQAAKEYEGEVKSLNEQLKKSTLNKPKERKVLYLANAELKSIKADNPDMTKAEIKKKSQQLVTKYRSIVGAKRHTINISDREWEAIQKGAISETMLKSILNNADKDRVRELATPKAAKETISKAKIATIKAMSSSNYTLNEIAKRVGISVDQVNYYLKGEQK